MFDYRFEINFPQSVLLPTWLFEPWLLTKRGTTAGQHNHSSHKHKHIARYNIVSRLVRNIWQGKQIDPISTVVIKCDHLNDFHFAGWFSLIFRMAIGMESILSTRNLLSKMAIFAALYIFIYSFVSDGNTTSTKEDKDSNLTSKTLFSKLMSKLLF